MWDIQILPPPPSHFRLRRHRKSLKANRCLAPRPILPRPHINHHQLPVSSIILVPTINLVNHQECHLVQLLNEAFHQQHNHPRASNFNYPTPPSGNSAPSPLLPLRRLPPPRSNPTPQSTLPSRPSSSTIRPWRSVVQGATMFDCITTS